jgi:hypothetical protein
MTSVICGNSKAARSFFRRIVLYYSLPHFIHVSISHADNISTAENHEEQHHSNSLSSQFLQIRFRRAEDKHATPTWASAKSTLVFLMAAVSRDTLAHFLSRLQGPRFRDASLHIGSPCCHRPRGVSQNSSAEGLGSSAAAKAIGRPSHALPPLS